MPRLTAAQLAPYKAPPGVLTAAEALADPGSELNAAVARLHETVNGPTRQLGEEIRKQGDRLDAARQTSEGRRLLRRGGRHMPVNAYIAAVADMRRATSCRPGHAPRAATNRRTKGSKRRTAGKSSSRGDPPEQPAKPCLGCDEPLIGKRPQALYHDDACRKRYERRGRSSGRTCATCATLLSSYNRTSECWLCEFEASLAVGIVARTFEPAEVELFPWLTNAEFDARCQELSNAPILEAVA